MLYTHLGKSPSVHPLASVAPNAVICGDVSIGPESVVGFGATLLAEGQAIKIGREVVMRENAVIRSTARFGVSIGDNVLIGPHATLFGCVIEDEVFLATGSSVFHAARVCRGAEVRINGVVHLRTVVQSGSTVPIGWVAVGDPASILPPHDHEAIWRIQEPLDFPSTVYGVERRADGTVDMREVTRRLVQAFKAHETDKPVGVNFQPTSGDLG